MESATYFKCYDCGRELYGIGVGLKVRGKGNQSFCLQCAKTRGWKPKPHPDLVKSKRRTNTV